MRTALAVLMAAAILCLCAALLVFRPAPPVPSPLPAPMARHEDPPAPVTPGPPEVAEAVPVLQEAPVAVPPPPTAPPPSAPSPPSPAAPAPPPVPGPPRRLLPPRDEKRETEWRTRLGGTLEAAARVLANGKRLNDWWGTERDIYWGWGTEGTLQALTLWQAGIRSEPSPNRGALSLARSEAGNLLGRKREAAALLVEAVLGMERERLQAAEGEPRLLAFALPPNSAPFGPDEWTEERRAKATWRSPSYGMSGAAGWGGGSGLVWEGDGAGYFEWVLQVAADDARPEEAMAATLWSHAVVLGFGWRRFPHDLPPAALRFLERQGVRTPPEEAALDWWTRTFEDSWAMALEREDPAAASLKRWRDRLCSLPDREGLGDWKADYAAFVLWSLQEEFADRFAKVDSPKAKELRDLAEQLLR